MEERSREPLELNSESEESDKSDLSVFSEGPACSHPQAPNIHQSQALQPVKSQDQVVVDQVESQDDPNSCTEIYQCSICIANNKICAGSLFSRRLFHTHPVVLYASLATVFSHILRHTPAGVSSYSLRCQTDLVKITLSNGVLNQPPHQIMHSEKMAIRNIPKDIRTVISWLQLSPRLNIYVCCRECFAIYDDSDSTPDLCTHSYIHGKASTSDTKTSSKRDHKNPSDLLTKKNSLSLSPPKQNKNEKALQTNNLTYMTSISTPSPIPLMPHSTHKQSTWTQAMSLLTPLWTMGGTQLKSLYDPIPFEPEIVTKYQDDYLESPVFNELIAKLNKKFSLSDSIWVLSTAYSQEVRQNRSSYSPVTSRAKFLKNHRVADEVYSVSNVNKNNSVIALKPGLQAAYGQIEKIFQHSRQMPNGKIELHVLCHCAWITYRAGELSDEISCEAIALVGLDRS
ncbi:hypothetical protein MJO28_006661 [Puccinia striiformis f. sp. tritici]|uniref:Uncharacterized protein n=1 Tax=Puccinia striiformis f. sp. tritici TaxID=168172 RepID=A0ACC0EJ21_9BASI|nr:hypothetical protein MJO28_006661 [Puccinia striiformis f. sp. tritici]